MSCEKPNGGKRATVAEKPMNQERVKRKEPKMNKKEREDEKTVLRILVRERDDIQAERIRADNRLGRLKSGEEQKKTKRDVSSDTFEMLREFSDIKSAMEKQIEEKLKESLKKWPIYTEYLSTVKGIGINLAAWIIAEIDIHEATNVSKIVQFAGLNSGMVKGKISVVKSKYKQEMGEIIGELPPAKNGKKRVKVLTDTLIRGDRKTEKFLCPYNSTLRMVLAGRLADSFIKSKSPYADFYYRLHIPEKYRDDEEAMNKRPELAGQVGRYDCSEQMTVEMKKGGKIVPMPWKDTTDSHRHKAARRVMIKEFLKDLYANWRRIEGLPVREPYAKEYLGKVHGQEKKAA
jgi:hypothetical protein